jgi:pimeloyl-ACP methyl ester carboxylesterase
MLYSLGQNLFGERSVGDDTSMEFLRVDGDPYASIICCLPWRMPYRLALASRFVPRNFLACYEMPRAIVSSEPELCVCAVHTVVDDALRVFARSRLEPSQLLVVGLSIGNAVATALANRIGARLCSIASADRGDLTLWESPASRQVKELAEAKGYKLSDFTHALKGLHTIENLENLAPGSRFVIAMKDELIPQPRREGLISAVHRVLPAADISYVDSGHFGTMAETVRRGLGEPTEVHLARA